MIKSLDQLTAKMLIDLICGDTSVLGTEDEDIPDSSKLITMRNIIFEYKEIADPHGAKEYLSHMEDLIKARLSVLMYTICSNLISLKKYDMARDILAVNDVSVASVSDERLIAKVESGLKRAQRDVSQLSEDKVESKDRKSDVRKAFDAQTASLMAYFKFQIDTATIKASVYANLVARHDREIKARASVLKK
ncbi:hypothetical protein [uncultured Duncaniella sp.]|uniref:hypothetical protein n=1 Tax=uncultured Duncaniella sp. TaxID=2768039 RepID=UPI002729B05A|nr:hypothetical protein [uncultured Duncaniella sp.]